MAGAGRVESGGASVGSSLTSTAAVVWLGCAAVVAVEGAATSDVMVGSEDTGVSLKQPETARKASSAYHLAPPSLPFLSWCLE